MKITLSILLLAVLAVGLLEARSAKTGKKERKVRDETLADNWKKNKIDPKKCKDDPKANCEKYVKKDNGTYFFRNPEFSRTKCPVSAFLCIKDKKEHDYSNMMCQDASSGCTPQACTMTVQAASSSCMATCGMCNPGQQGPCDSNSLCQGYGRAGQCGSQAVQSGCGYSCGESGPYSGVPQAPYPYQGSQMPMPGPFEPYSMQLPTGAPFAQFPPEFQQSGYTDPWAQQQQYVPQQQYPQTQQQQPQEYPQEYPQGQQQPQYPQGQQQPQYPQGQQQPQGEQQQPQYPQGQQQQQEEEQQPQYPQGQQQQQEEQKQAAGTTQEQPTQQAAQTAAPQTPAAGGTATQPEEASAQTGYGAKDQSSSRKHKKKAAKHH